MPDAADKYVEPSPTARPRRLLTAANVVVALSLVGSLVVAAMGVAGIMHWEEFTSVNPLAFDAHWSTYASFITRILLGVASIVAVLKVRPAQWAYGCLAVLNAGAFIAWTYPIYSHGLAPIGLLLVPIWFGPSIAGAVILIVRNSKSESRVTYSRALTVFGTVFVLSVIAFRAVAR